MYNISHKWTVFILYMFAAIIKYQINYIIKMVILHIPGRLVASVFIELIKLFSNKPLVLLLVIPVVVAFFTILSPLVVTIYY